MDWRVALSLGRCVGLGREVWLHTFQARAAVVEEGVAADTKSRAHSGKRSRTEVVIDQRERQLLVCRNSPIVQIRTVTLGYYAVNLPADGIPTNVRYPWVLAKSAHVQGR